MAARPDRLPEAAALTVVTLSDPFLDHSHAHHDPETSRQYKLYLDWFTGAYGTTPAADLKPFHVTRWLDDHPGWKASRRHAALAVKARSTGPSGWACSPPPRSAPSRSPRTTPEPGC